MKQCLILKIIFGLGGLTVKQALCNERNRTFIKSGGKTASIFTRKAIIIYKRPKAVIFSILAK